MNIDEESQLVVRLEAALARCRLFVGYADQRGALALQLATEAVSASQVEQLAEWAKGEFSAAKRKGGLVNVLKDRDRRDQVLRDIAYVESVARPKKQEPGLGDRIDPSGPEQWDDMDRAARVVARVEVDLSSRGKVVGNDFVYLTEEERIAIVAEEFGFEIGMAKYLLTLGRKHRPRHEPDPSKPELPTKADHRAKVTEFRDAMAESKRRGVPLSEVMR